MKLWGGRYSKDTAKPAEDFNASISVDSRLYLQDIEGSKAHAFMLGECGIISAAEAADIINALEEIRLELESSSTELENDAEDIHMNIEKLLIEKLGETGKKLHTARSRNDQVALDLRMFLKEEIHRILKMFIELETLLLNIAAENTNTIMPGYTHMQKAQPISLGHHFMAYFEMFKRDMGRFTDCLKRIDVMPLGSCALAGTTYPIDRKMVADILGFSDTSLNSVDAVSDRDFAIEFISCCAFGMMHLSRFCEELVIWNTEEFGYIEMDDGYSTGSSIMPQKKNPDIAELIRGKTGRVYGDLICLLTVVKGLPLSYNKDLQEDKEPVFDAGDTLKSCISVFIPMLSSMTINKDRIKSNLRGGFLNATDLADYLVKKGLAFRDAHEISGKIVSSCITRNKELTDLSLDDFKSFAPCIEEEVFEFLKPEVCLGRRNTEGGPSAKRVTEAVLCGREFIKHFAETLINK
ncbi:MAG TPA: argininosuccinate lyase [Bacillota bacterium]|nr:argininosuccinate lyase [Bacillota bacterium]HPL52712.1 argininosuccinate lyase [Bacillota bacterium]